MNNGEDRQSSERFSLFEWTSQHLKSVAGLRDGLLVTASILYVVGYMVWSFNALQNHLGLLPALDPQYFVAGLIPVVIILMAYSGGTYFKRFLVDTWPGLVNNEAVGFRRAVRLTLLFVFWALLGLLAFGPVLAAFLVLIYLGYKLLKRFAPNTLERLSGKEAKGWELILRLALTLLALAAFLFLLSKRKYLSRTILSGHAESVDRYVSMAFAIIFILLPPMEDSFLSWFSRVYRWFLAYFGTLLVVFVGLTFYVQKVYPTFPQEFGGVRPRCASLDVVKAQVSHETLQDIVSTEAIKSTQPVVRSLKVEILYSGSSVVLVRSQGRVYEIAKNVIQTINACD
jgi:hypothetical protein